jgi:MoxR-like ATPase
MLSRRFIEHIEGGKYFEILLTAYSTPEELFGPFAMSKLEKDIYERVTSGYLPEAHICFIDETFKANSGILNSMLWAMNEREFRNGDHIIKLPLLTLIGASNEIPDDDENLGALYDRFHMKFHTLRIQEPGNFMKMMKMPDYMESPETIITIDDLEKAKKEISQISIPQEVITKLTKLREELYSNALIVTDRTYKVSARTLRTEAWFKGHKTVEDEDMDILRHLFWSEPEKARHVYLKILEMVNPDKNKIMTLYEDCMTIAKEVFAIKDPKKQLEEGIEAATKIKEARKKINKLINEMEKKKKNTEEVRQMAHEIDKQLKEIFVEACNIDFTG